MKTYTASVVGAGKGGMLSIRALMASERFQFQAVADINPAACEAIQAQFPEVRTFSSHQEMFAECPTDVLCVATYAPTHKPIALQATQELSLKGILVEKPLANTAGAGREIIETLRAKQIPMAVPHGLLVADHSTEILQRVRDGQIGQLKLVEMISPRWDIINAGIHWINFFVALTGNEPVESVMATCDTSTRTYRDGMQVETEAVTYITTQSGVRFVMQTGDGISTNRKDTKMQFRLVGTGGIIEFWAWKPAYILLNAEHPEGKLFEITPAPATPHQRHLDNLALQIDSGEQDYTVAESSLTALEICEAAYLSSKCRCSVKFPLDQFKPPEPTDWQPGQPYEGVGGGKDGANW